MQISRAVVFASNAVQCFQDHLSGVEFIAKHESQQYKLF